MDQLSVVRWKRYGKDRLYVNGPHGVRVGWHDLQTGESHVELAELSAEFHAAIADALDAVEPASAEGAAPNSPLRADHAAMLSPAVPEPLHRTPDVDGLSGPSGAVIGASASDDAVVPGPIPPESTVADPDPDPNEDLGMTRPGALVRAQAKALREEAPLRTLFARVLGVHTDERAFRIGADGEEKVGTRLEKLARKDPRWRFVHSVPVGDRGSDIDHVVIGPAGVFTLNTKHHPGKKVWVGGDTVIVGGHRQPYVRNSRYEARRASELLSTAAGMHVSVRSVVVLADAEDLTVKTQPADVVILWRQALVRWLRGLPETLDEAAINLIYEIARHSATWRP